MVYMLGCDDMNLASLLVPVSLCQLVPYQDGVLKNFNKVPRYITSRRIKGDCSLSLHEQFLLRGINMVNTLAGIRNNKRFLFLFNPPKPTPKGKAYFSLKDLISSYSRSPAVNAVTSTLVAVNPSPSRNIPLRPVWLFSDIIRKHDARLEAFKVYSKRAIGIEFLLDAVSAIRLIGCDNIDVCSTAFHLELAVFHRYSSDGVQLSYWDAIHAVSAAIAGKNKVGTLCFLLAQGYFSHPEAIVVLTTKELYNSFLQLPLDYIGPA